MKWLKYIGAVVFLLVVISGVAVWVWGMFIGWTSGTAIKQPITRLQYFKSPALVAVHVEKPPRVLLIHNIRGENLSFFERWLDPSNVEIVSLDVDAESIYGKWSDSLDSRDVLQFGVHGLPRGSTLPNYGNEVSMGLNGEDFPHGSFEVVGEDEFNKLSLGPAATDTKAWGWMRFGQWNHYQWGKKPIRSPGP